MDISNNFRDNHEPLMGAITPKRFKHHLRQWIDFLITHKKSLEITPIDIKSESKWLETIENSSKCLQNTVLHSRSITIITEKALTKSEIKLENNLDYIPGLHQNLSLDCLYDFDTKHLNFGGHSSIIKLTLKLNKKLRSIFNKDVKGNLIEKTIGCIQVWDILFDDLQAYKQIIPTDLPKDYDYERVSSLMILKKGAEKYQVLALENFYVNLKRSLLGLMHYILVLVKKSTWLYKRNMTIDEYLKVLVTKNSKPIKTYLFCKTWNPFLALKGNDLYKNSDGEETVNIEDLIITNEKDIITKIMKICSVLNYIEAIKTQATNWDLFLVFLFKDESSSSESEFESLTDPFFDSIQSHLLKEDPKESKYNHFNHVLQLKAVLLESDSSKSCFLENKVHLYLSKYTQNLLKTCKRDLYEKTRNRKKDLPKTVNDYLLRLRMCKSLIQGHRWGFCKDEVEEIFESVQIVEQKIVRDKRNMIIASK